MISPEEISLPGIVPQKIEPLFGDGSARRFFRIHTRKQTFVLVLPQPGNIGLREARSYYLLGNFLRAHGIPVPEILYYDEARGILLLEDLGNTRLAEHPDRDRFYPQAIEILVQLQGLASYFPREAILETLYYDAKLIWEREILYFETWYLQRYCRRRWSPSQRDLWANFLKETVKRFTDTVVLHRDYQSRNLMVKGTRLFLIDFQAARLGPPGYDLASLLKDPYVPALTERKWFRYYLRLSGRNPDLFKEEFQRLAIFRLMQALAAFVKLSSQGKSWFRDPIPRAEKRLKTLLPRDLRETIWP